LREEDDGSVVIADPDQAPGAIRLTAEQVERAAHWLATRRSQRRAAQIELHSDVS
jgi:hypothetical protein